MQLGVDQRATQRAISPAPAPSLRVIVRAVVSPPIIGDRPIDYFYAIDLLRGVAAIAIIFWHYVHFYMIGTTAVGYDPTTNPLYSVFALFYDHGGNAVQLFWLISGFTFSAVYTARQVNTHIFVVHRFARLYPLQLLTLCIVAALQIVSIRLLGHSSIYGNVDVPHFIDQLFMTDGWGSSVRFSFNGPTWTVSVELLIYALFWLLLPWLFRFGVVLPLGIAAVSLVMSRFGPFSQILQGGFYFFTGCALYPTFLACRGRLLAMILSAGLPLVTALVVISRWHAVGITSTLLLIGLVLAASFTNGGWGRPGVRHAFKWVGDNTYGIYLWHVPIQTVILIVVGSEGWSRTIYQRPVFLIAYVTAVILVARLSFRLIERPCRRFLNARLAGPAI